MDRNHRRHRSNLKAIARRAMIERDLLPDFSADVVTEIGRIKSAAIEKDPKIRDLRGLLWASIDNDDSEDLDQLTVAEPQPRGAVMPSLRVPQEKEPGFASSTPRWKESS